jgi:hypothetical protein
MRANALDDAWAQWEGGVAEALAEAERVALVLAEAFAAPNIGLLPDLGGAQASGLANIAPLLLVAELDRAGVIETAEALSRMASTGALPHALPRSQPKLRAFWRKRRERLDRDEREALYAQTFPEPDFSVGMQRFCRALTDLVVHGGDVDVARQVALQVAGEQLRMTLADSGVGMVGAATGDLLRVITESLDLLREPELQSAFAARSWGALVGLSQGGGTSPALQASRLQRHLDRGRAGQHLLLWLAAHPEQSVPQATERNLLAAHAQRWLLAQEPASARGAPAPPRALALALALVELEPDLPEA